jgi:hypothetical protein
LKRSQSRLRFALVNLFTLKLRGWIPLLIVFAAFPTFAHPQSIPTPVPTADKLDVERIASVALETRRKLLSALTPSEREKFFEQFIRLPPGASSNGKINALFMAWSQVEPKAALENAMKLPSRDARRAAIEAICYGMKSEDAHEMAVSWHSKQLIPHQLADGRIERCCRIRCDGCQLPNNYATAPPGMVNPAPKGLQGKRLPLADSAKYPHQSNQRYAASRSL